MVEAGKRCTQASFGLKHSFSFRANTRILLKQMCVEEVVFNASKHEKGGGGIWRSE